MEFMVSATGTAGSRYGVYGSASGGTFNAAGYFDGDVWADSYNILSDRKFKTGITQLESSTSLDHLMKLKPSAYEFNTPAYPKMGLPKGKQLGLIADEVKQVFPELVKEAVHPAEYSQDKKEVLRPEEKFEGVNYIGFIPVLIASLQEQQKTIATLQDRITKLEASLAVSNDVSGGNMKNVSLLQNRPNPFSQVTNINYSIPEGADGQIRIYDAAGNMVKTMRATENGQVQLNAYELKAGTYTYVLVVNGNATASKKMVLLK